MSQLDDWSLAGTRAGQYRSDLAADAAALEVLEPAGVGVLSEESGRHRPDAEVVVVLDPVDGSTNAAHGIPWYATSLCAVDGDGARAALVVNLASGDRFEAVRGGGARRNGASIVPAEAARVGRRRSSRCRAIPAARWGGASSGRWARPRSTCARWPAA